MESKEIEVSLKVDGIDIAGRLYMPERTGKQSEGLIICHGLPAQVKAVDDQGYPLLAGGFCRAGFTTFIFNFRGCGLSGGNFDILGWSRDIKAAIDLVYSKVDRLWLMGFSAGAVTSIYVAAQDSRIAGLVSCACPVNFKLGNKEGLELARRNGIIKDADFPPSVEEWAEGFVKVNPINWVDKISPRPLLLIHGDQDEVVPVQDVWFLYHKAKEPKEVRVISGAGHRLRLSETAMQIAMDWLKTRVKS
jgi:alpha/beta superfamily hydrolase